MSLECVKSDFLLCSLVDEIETLLALRSGTCWKMYGQVCEERENYLRKKNYSFPETLVSFECLLLQQSNNPKEKNVSEFRKQSREI